MSVTADRRVIVSLAAALEPHRAGRCVKILVTQGRTEHQIRQVVADVGDPTDIGEIEAAINASNSEAMRRWNVEKADEFIIDWRPI
jgi:hypothetical protein